MAYSDIASKQYGRIEEEIPVPSNAAGYHQQQGPIGYQNLQSASVLPATDPSRERQDREDTEAGNTFVEHLKLDFEDCFREHKSTKLVDPIYKVYGITYKYIKLAVYHLLVLVFGIPIAIIWALINAIIAFTCTWLWSPVLKIVVLLIYGISPLVTETVRAFMSPLVDMSARILRQIRLHVTTGDKLTEAIGALGRSKAV
ncbi:hypothetical protein EMCRGX_G026146 [Ephydatia muelleri]